MLRIAAITTNFKEYETELGVNMLTCIGIHTDLQHDVFRQTVGKSLLVPEPTKIHMKFI